MSHDIYTAVIGAVAHIAGDGYGDLKDWHLMVIERGDLASDPGAIAEIERSGWRVRLSPGSDAWEAGVIGNHDEVYTVVVRKGDNAVHVWNSSQGSHVGEYRISAASDDEETLIEFLSDVAPHAFRYVDAPGVAEMWC